MNHIEITPKNKRAFNEIVSHPLQSYEWGEFREKTGIKVIRIGFEENDKLTTGIQMTIHKIPHTSATVGYIPKSVIPTSEQLAIIKKIGKENACIFIQFEPDVKESGEAQNTMGSLGFIPSSHPLFTKYTFQLDLTRSEEELLKSMHPKTRYNIRVAQKHGVEVIEENSEDAFDSYLHLTQETTVRQGFYAHTSTYHRIMWETLHNKKNPQGLQSHLFVAYLPGNKQKIPLTTWLIFTFQDKLYYPYGASSNMHRESMSSTLMMWSVILFGKQKGLKVFDMWGALGPDPDTKDAWFGFHRFKQGFGPQLISFLGSYDLVLNPLGYFLFKQVNNLRWILLRLKKYLL